MLPGFEPHRTSRSEGQFRSSQQHRKSGPHISDSAPMNGLPPPEPYPFEPLGPLSFDFFPTMEPIIPPPPEFQEEQRRGSYPSMGPPFSHLDGINSQMRSPERVTDRREVRTSDLFPSDLDLTDGQTSSPELRSPQHVGEQVCWYM